MARSTAPLPHPHHQHSPPLKKQPHPIGTGQQRPPYRPVQVGAPRCVCVPPSPAPLRMEGASLVKSCKVCGGGAVPALLQHLHGYPADPVLPAPSPV